MKHPACDGCEFEGNCITERMDMEADCQEVINWESERDVEWTGDTNDPRNYPNYPDMDDQ